MAPARILACQPQHEGPHLGRHGRAPALARRLPPLPAHKRAMPPQQRPRSDQPRPTRRAWQVARRRREQGTISGAKPRPRDLAAQDLELVAQDQQLDVLDVQATTTPNECAQKGPEREVEKRERHGRQSSQPSRRQGATRLLAPFRARDCVVDRIERVVRCSGDLDVIAARHPTQRVSAWRFPQQQRSDRPPHRGHDFLSAREESRPICRCAQRCPESPFAFTCGPVLAGP
jgi:hypothetical protein